MKVTDKTVSEAAQEAAEKLQDKGIDPTDPLLKTADYVVGSGTIEDSTEDDRNVFFKVRMFCQIAYSKSVEVKMDKETGAITVTEPGE